MKIIENEVVILYREDIFSAWWTNIQPANYDEMAYFLKVKGEKDLYFMIGKPEESFFVDIK